MFAALLGDRDNGRWLIAPAGGLQRTERRYLDDTLVLETTFHTDDGVVKVTDCMPIRGRTVDIDAARRRASRAASRCTWT